MNKRINSIKKKLNNESNELEIVRLNYDLAFEYSFINAAESCKYALIAKNIANEIGYKAGVDYYKLYVIIKAYFKRKRASKDDYIKLLDAHDYYVSIQDLKMVAFSCNAMGKYHYLSKSYELAYQRYMEAADLYKKLNYNFAIIYVYKNIGQLLRQLRRFEEELEFYKRSIKISSREKRDVSYYFLLLYTGEAYMNLNNVKKSKDMVKIIESYTKFDEIPSLKSKVLSLKAALSLEENDFENAIMYIEESMDIISENSHLTCRLYYLLGQYYSKIGNLPSGINYLKMADRLARSVNDIKIQKEATELLYKVYKQKGEFKNAYKMFEQFYDLEMDNFDTVASIRNQTIVTNIRIQLLEEKRKELKWMSTHDELTDVYNRRSIISEYNSMINENKRVFVLLVDIDDFKNINDQYGHATGDKVICEVADILENSICKRGIVGRYGGDEFIALLDKVDKGLIETIVNKIEEEIRALIVDNIRITISGGLVRAKEEQSLDDVLASADKVLYEVKADEKNKIKVVV